MKRLVAPLVLAVLLATAGLAAPAAAQHGSQSNFTVVPHDRSPGVTDATYQQHAVSPITFERLDWIRATYKEGGFTGCGSTNSKVFGIDRNDDEPGTKVDESLKQYAKETKVEKHTFYVDFYDEDDAFGTTTNLDAGDEFVSLTENCFDNPDQPGWYQIESTIAGTATNGTHIEAHDTSHYFYVCDCDSRAEAREKLGPPPSASTPTPTATPTPTRTPPAEGTPYPSPTPTATPERTTATPQESPNRGAPASTPTASSEDTSAGTTAETPTPTPGPEDWDSAVRRTPTVGSGPGFGPAGAFAGLLLTALLALRRRE